MVIEAFDRTVCACTSAEGHKRRRLGDELESHEQLGNVFITSANTSIPESTFNQLRKPGWIAALKVVQTIPQSPENIRPFTIGVIAAELGNTISGSTVENTFQKAEELCEEMVHREMPITLVGTDVVLQTSHPNEATYANVNQPGDVSDDELISILRSRLHDCENPIIREGLIPATFTVGMAACELDIKSGIGVGQSGEVSIDFSYTPVSMKEIRQYVQKHGERARKVNGGIMWEYFQHHIQIVNAVGRESSDFYHQMGSFVAMTSGMPHEIGKFLSDLSNRNHLKSTGCVHQTMSDLKKISNQYLGREVNNLSWHAWHDKKTQVV